MATGSLWDEDFNVETVIDAAGKGPYQPVNFPAGEGPYPPVKVPISR